MAGTPWMYSEKSTPRWPDALQSIVRQTVHGMATGANRDPIYSCWRSMMAPLEDPKAAGCRYWGGRAAHHGLGPWHAPAVYKADVEREIGPRPSRT